MTENSIEIKFLEYQVHFWLLNILSDKTIHIYAIQIDELYIQIQSHIFLYTYIWNVISPLVSHA